MPRLPKQLRGTGVYSHDTKKPPCDGCEYYDLCKARHPSLEYSRCEAFEWYLLQVEHSGAMPDLPPEYRRLRSPLEMRLTTRGMIARHKERREQENENENQESLHG